MLSPETKSGVLRLTRPGHTAPKLQILHGQGLCTCVHVCKYARMCTKFREQWKLC